MAQGESDKINLFFSIQKTSIWPSRREELRATVTHMVSNGRSLKEVSENDHFEWVRNPLNG